MWEKPHLTHINTNYSTHQYILLTYSIDPFLSLPSTLYFCFMFFLYLFLLSNFSLLSFVLALAAISPFDKLKLGQTVRCVAFHLNKIWLIWPFVLCHIICLAVQALAARNQNSPNICQMPCQKFYIF